MTKNRRHRAELAEAQMVLALPGVAPSKQQDAPPPPLPSACPPDDPQFTSLEGGAIARGGTSGRVATPLGDVAGQKACILKTIGTYPPQDACHATRVELGVPITQLLELYDLLRPFVCNGQEQPGAPGQEGPRGGEGTGRSK
jgi:hypothetical protein